MPEYVSNVVTVRGPADVLSEIKEHTFDFDWIHPIPENAEKDWTSRHWTTNRNRDPTTFHVEEESEDGCYMKVWFRTTWSTPYALFAYMTTKWPTLSLSVRHSIGYAIDSVGHAEYANGRVKDICLSPGRETPKALATFSRDNPWFDYQQWKKVQIDVQVMTFEDVDDTPDDSVTVQHLSSKEGSYDRIVCEYDNHGDFTNEIKNAKYVGLATIL